MGSGIALTAAQAGIAAFQVDLSAAQLEKAKAYHLKTLGVLWGLLVLLMI